MYEIGSKVYVGNVLWNLEFNENKIIGFMIVFSVGNIIKVKLLI